jgi:hypothetical protein
LKGYSVRLARMAMAAAAVSAMGLLGAAAWQHRQQGLMDGVFRPQERIARVDQLTALLGPQGPRPGAEDLQDSPTQQACTGRQRGLLIARVAAAENLSPQEAQGLVDRGWMALHEGGNPARSCAQYLGEMLMALRYRTERRAAREANPPPLEEWLSERLDWNTVPTCLEGRVEDRRILISGNTWRCGVQVPWLGLAESGVMGTWREVALSAARVPPGGDARPSGPPAHRVYTLDAPLQALLDRAGRCVSHATDCSPALRRAASMQSASVVIMDATSGDLLAMMCAGPLCEQPSRGYHGAMAALLVDAPAASTVKLVHALALAATPGQDPVEVERQLKTSGQLDASVTKRNEWWERQAICDPTTRAPGARVPMERIPCDMMARVQQSATALMLNTHCPVAAGRTALNCGRVGLAQADDPVRLPGFIGRVALGSPTQRPATLPWADYDAIRQGKAQPPKEAAAQRAYALTSQSVQSVIGAGDERISALGLAVLGTSIWRLSEGRPVVAPRLLKSGAESVTVSGSVGLERPKQGTRQAAQVVHRGMARVVEPEERGWAGAGTAASAVQSAFGKACSQSCGLWAKTGTVSYRDPALPGATLLVLNADLAATAAWLGKPKGLLQERRVTVGVLVQPPHAGQGGHLASQFGMALVRELFP